MPSKEVLAKGCPVCFPSALEFRTRYSQVVEVLSRSFVKTDLDIGNQLRDEADVQDGLPNNTAEHTLKYTGKNQRKADWGSYPVFLEAMAISTFLSVSGGVPLLDDA